MKKEKWESVWPSITTSAFPASLKATITGAPAGEILRMNKFLPSADQSTLNTGQSLTATSGAAPVSVERNRIRCVSRTMASRDPSGERLQFDPPFGILV